MKKVTLICLFLISLVSCNSDDNEDVGSKTFIELNNGSKWKYTEDENNNGKVDGIVYLKFNNNMEIPYESWGSTQNSEQEEWKCYEHFNFKLNSYDEPILFHEIIENTVDKLVIQITIRENHYETNIFTKSGEKMKVQIIGDEMGSSYGGTIYFDKTSDKISDIQVCN